MARPKASIDFDKVTEYLRAQCSGAAIAGLLGVHPDTLYRAIEQRYKVTFSAFSAQKKSEGREVLKKSMYDLALKGNVTIAIWLSKQYLGFTDSIEKLNDEIAEVLIEKIKLKYEEEEPKHD